MQRRYEALLKHARDIILFIGEDGRILEANDAAVAAYGYSREELCALSIHDLRAPDTRADVGELMKKAFREGLLFESFHKRRDGSTFPVEVSSIDALADQKMLLSIIRDISERKRSEAALAEANAVLEAKVAERTTALEEANRDLAARLEALERAEGVIEEQARAIVEQSTPVLELWDSLLVAPLIGMLGQERLGQLEERLLGKVAAMRAQVVLLDITGVPALDSEVTGGLLRIIGAIRLLGAELIITGMSPATAREVVALGLDWSGVSTHATLAVGLRDALGRLGFGVGRRITRRS